MGVLPTYLFVRYRVLWNLFGCLLTVGYVRFCLTIHILKLFILFIVLLVPTFAFTLLPTFPSPPHIPFHFNNILIPLTGNNVPKILILHTIQCQNSNIICTRPIKQIYQPMTISIVSLTHL
jgi:hypothetical protein